MVPVTSAPEADARLAIGVAELAARLGVSRKTLDRAVSRGEVGTFKLGFRRLVPMREVERLVGTTPAATA